MSDWADFCEGVGIDPNAPNQFDEWLYKESTAQTGAPGRSALVNHRKRLANLADPGCDRCGGTGYLGKYRWNCGGRCFRCLPDERWGQ